jgi:regulation of enolase protein 1 (concanavalin A-like superfamily)
MKSGDDPKTFSIDLSDAQELQLVVVALGNKECDWSIWGNPILTKEPTGKVNSSLNYKIVTRMPTSSDFGQSATKTPTINSTPTVSPILHGVIFREDFDDEDFEPELKWENYNPKKCNFYNKGYLGLVGEPDSLLHNNRQSNLLWYTLPEGEYALTVHLNGIFKLDFQQAAIFLYQDANNYVTINRAYCSLCPPAGNGFYMNYKNAGAFGEYSVRTDKNDVYLRLEKKNNVISGYYATEPDQWNRLGRFSADYSNFTKAGFGITNDGTVNNALVTLDYFEVSIP